MFADRLKEARKQKKISQEKLGEMLNVSQSAISSYESGARKPDIDFLPQIAQALDVSVSYLLEMDEKTDKNPKTSAQIKMLTDNIVNATPYLTLEDMERVSGMVMSLAEARKERGNEK